MLEHTWNYTAISFTIGLFLFIVVFIAFFKIEGRYFDSRRDEMIDAYDRFKNLKKEIEEVETDIRKLRSEVDEFKTQLFWFKQLNDRVKIIENDIENLEIKINRMLRWE